jgi:hypothetical protein
LGKYQTTSKKESNNRAPHHIPYNNSFHQGVEPRIRAANAAARTKHPAISPSLTLPMRRPRDCSPVGMMENYFVVGQTRIFDETFQDSRCPYVLKGSKQIC